MMKMTNSMTNLMMNIKHFYQPTGNTCGPTCLFMAYQYINTKHILPQGLISIKEIEIGCGTDWIVGTPPDRMINGMKALNLNYVEYIHSPNPYELLKSVIDSENIPILRTITKGVPHWIIVSDYNIDENSNTTKYQILDPWQGEIIYNEKSLNEVWEKRQYQFFEILNPKKVLVDPLTGQINLRYDVDAIDEDYYL